jgi:two-component system response regulator AtoC
MDPLSELIGRSAEMAALRGQVRRLLRIPTRRALPPVLLLGETGTGKGLLARLLHRAGPCAAGPFVDVNCAAIPETLLEAELFGFERGAFTDARQAKPGLFQVAHRGTLFLDEVGLLPDALQAKLLTAIESRQVRRLGSTRNEPVNVWILAATSEDLTAAMAARHFRPELYHRLSTLVLRLPSLRARRNDVLDLAGHFLRRVATEHGLPEKSLGADAREVLLSHDWPGNVRELANVLERATLLGDGPVITASMLGLSPIEAQVQLEDKTHRVELSLDSIRSQERQQLIHVLMGSRGNISRAAAQLGIPRNTLRYRMAKLGLSLSEPQEVLGNRNRPRASNERQTKHWEARRVTLLLFRVSLVNDGDVSVPLGRALEIATEKVETFGGRIEELGPDTMLAAYGLDPVEDAPRRAALAALAIQRAVERATVAIAATPGMRIALHTADVLVADSERSPRISPNDRWGAVRTLDELTTFGGPSRIALDSVTRTLVERWFEVTRIGRIEGILSRR